MAIACAYCGGEHDSPTQVRQCWNDGGQQDVPIADDPIPHPADDPSLFDDTSSAEQPSPPRRPRSTSPSPTRRPTTVDVDVERGVAPAGAGPDALGRHLLIEPGDPIAAPWSGAERLVIDDAVLSAPGHALGRLRSAHHTGTRLVVELSASFEREPMLMTEAAPYELGPMFLFDLEELHHLVWS